jgi:NAD(P)-dependent dehydrogenase (short-subunit alcohol dehydrogenase family)
MSSARPVVIGRMTELLTHKNAIIYGGGGSIGGAAARTFAREGATVFLAGRTRESLDRVAADVAAAGGRAEVAVVDALDERAVDEHADAVAAQAGSIDVSFNVVPRGDDQGTPLVDMALDRYLHAIATGATTAFITARAAARHMAPRGAGVILHLTSGSSRGTMPGMGNTGPTDAAVEAFYRYLAAELGPSGVRVAGIHTAGVAGTLTRESIAEVSGAADVDVDAIAARIAQMAMLRRQPELQQVADTAAFLASDRAGAITSGIVNATCGLVAG